MSVVLITGCSTGIGRALARVCADAGDTVFATMRDTADRVLLIGACRVQTTTGAQRPGAMVPCEVGVTGPEAAPVRSGRRRRLLRKQPDRLWGAT